MGGRGQRSQMTIGWEVVSELERDYELITQNDTVGRAVYPFLDMTGRAWSLTTHPAGESVSYHETDVFGLLEPTLRWVNGDNVVDLFVDGMTTADFLETTGLELDLHKGGFVLSKRLSRIMRPGYANGFFDGDTVNIQYMDQTADEAKVWDGAGLVSRRMLERLIDQLPDVDERRRTRLVRELQHGDRVEFTVMTERGQDKGHCIVSDTLDCDFLLPQDTKREVRLKGDQTFVGINFVHGHDDMRLDIQSLINLYPFFEPEGLGKYLANEGQLFVESIATGDVGAAMGRIDRFTTAAELADWPLREYLASGGSPNWFRAHIRGFANQHLKRLNESTLGKMRLPIPGGRYYVMPEGVGKRAGRDVQVGRGEIRIDHAAGTAWVNDDDWLQLADSERGIAGILGGADNDDALWVHPFTDHDGGRKVLAWRSPNQAGEYVILNPMDNSDALDWETPDGLVSYPPADSRKLIDRTDKQPSLDDRYLGLVDPATAGGLGEEADYTIAVMNATIERAVANRGALGAYCNNLMLAKAVYEQLPANPPAPLEDVIDASVKTGEDLSGVLAWTQQAATRMLERKTPIPATLHDRLGPRRPGTPTPRPTTDHWLDRLTSAVQTHIADIRETRDTLSAAAMPPRPIFDAAVTQPETVEIGAKLNQTYTRALRRLGDEPTPEEYDAARRETEAFLDRYPASMHTAILRGAIVSAYIRDEPGSDAAVWLSGEKTAAGRAPGIANKTIQALREVGVLDEITATDNGLVAYPGATVQEAPYRTLGIRGVWHNLYNGWAVANGGEPVASARDVPKAGQRWAKDAVKRMAGTGEPMTLHIREEDGVQVAYTVDGRRFGTLTEQVEGEMVAAQVVLAHDGSIRVIKLKD
ncbi:MAG: hypothetical protein AAFU54_10180 [Chloroflexota bacterium]